jgi:predicted TIM-barrel fold metal-dependent hydrolase
MKNRLPLLAFLLLIIPGTAFGQSRTADQADINHRIRHFIDSIPIFDTHEHLFDPQLLKKTDLLDFTMLLQQNVFDDLVSAGMPDTLFSRIYGNRLRPAAKWRLIEPYWNKTFNTSYSRILLLAINDLYSIKRLNATTVETLSREMNKAYEGEWFNHVIRDLCKIDNIIQSGDKIHTDGNYIRYAAGFGSWLTVRTKYSIDSLALNQTEPIFTLDDFVNSMKRAFNTSLSGGMAVVKINFAYSRTLHIENPSSDAARKVFRALVNGNEDKKISFAEAKPLQDYMVHQLLMMANQNNIPVAFHTGMLAGSGNFIENSNPVLLSEIFLRYPNLKFVLFHGSYPFGGELATLAKTFKNVYIDMNWVYAISPSYAARYLDEWLETIPVNKIMAFGGDQRMVEITYGNLQVAKQVITEVLSEKVHSGIYSEPEAKVIAKMILHDNGMDFYNLH